MDSSLSDSEITPMPQASSFETQCKKLDIALPTVNAREMQHLITCADCQACWPKFYFFHVYLHKNDLDTVSQQFASLPETKRKQTLTKINKFTDKWLKKQLKKRSPHAYQIYVKQMWQEPQYQNLSFIEKTRALSKVWKTLTSTQKSKYNQISIRQKNSYKYMVSEFPAFIKQWLKQAKKQKHNLRKNTFVKKPLNCFFLFRKQVAEEHKAKQSALSYKDITTLCSQKWKVMSEEEKQPFREQAALETQYYQRNKQEAIVRNKKRKRELKEFAKEEQERIKRVKLTLQHD